MTAVRKKHIVIYSLLSALFIFLFIDGYPHKIMMGIIIGMFALGFIAALINCIFFDNKFSNGKSSLQKLPPLEQDAKNAVKFGLGKCPNCFNEVSRLASKCPHCTASI